MEGQVDMAFPVTRAIAYGWVIRMLFAAALGMGLGIPTEARSDGKFLFNDRGAAATLTGEHGEHLVQWIGPDAYQIPLAEWSDRPRTLASMRLVPNGAETLMNWASKCDLISLRIDQVLLTEQQIDQIISQNPHLRVIGLNSTESIPGEAADFTPAEKKARDSSKLTTTSLEKIVGLSQLRTLELGNIGSADLTVLKRAAHVHNLVLTGATLDDPVLAAIAEMPELHLLHLRRCDVDARSLWRLRGGKQLIGLRFEEIPESRDLIAAMVDSFTAKPPPLLSILGFDRMELSEKEVDSITAAVPFIKVIVNEQKPHLELSSSSNPQSLRQSHFAAQSLKEYGLAEYRWGKTEGKSNEVSYLRIDYGKQPILTWIDAFVALLPDLSEIVLVNADVDRNLMSELGLLKNLTIARFESCRLGQEATRGIGGLNHLTFLSLASSELSVSDLSNLQKCQDIESLFLERVSQADDIAKIVSSAVSPQFISLSESDITDAGINSLSKLTSLRELLLNGTAITDDGVNSLLANSHVNVISANKCNLTPAASQRLIESEQVCCLSLGDILIQSGEIYDEYLAKNNAFRDWAEAKSEKLVLDLAGF